MARNRVAERVGLQHPVRIVCQCGKRLAIGGGFADQTGGFDLVMLQTFRLRRGQPVIADDWLEFSCPACKKRWAGRRGTLEAAWRAAVARKADSFTLPVAPATASAL